MGAKRVVAALLVLLLGACAPEPTEPPEPAAQTTPEPIVPVMRDGYYRLVDGNGISNGSIYGGDITHAVESFGHEITTSEVTSITLLDYVEYLSLVTSSSDGTKASVGFGMGWYFSFESTTGADYGCMAFGDRVDWRISSSTVSSRIYPPGWYALEPSEDGTLEWKSALCTTLDGCGYYPVGWVEFLNDATGFTLHIESETSHYVLDKTISQDDEAEIYCSTEEKGCKIRKYVEPDE